MVDGGEFVSCIIICSKIGEGDFGKEGFRFCDVY